MSTPDGFVRVRWPRSRTGYAWCSGCESRAVAWGGLPGGSISLDDAQARVVSKMHQAGQRKTDAEIQAEIDSNPDGELFATVAQLNAGVWTPAVGRTSVTMRIDCAVLNAYKATGNGWQTRMHAVLEGAAPSAADDAAGDTARTRANGVADDPSGEAAEEECRRETVDLPFFHPPILEYLYGLG